MRKRPEEKNRYIDMDLQYKLREEYINICKANGGVLISTVQDKEESYNQVKQAVERVMRNGNL